MDALQKAVEFLRAGRKAEAQNILIALVKQDATNAQAWYLLSYTLAERPQQIDCLKRALHLNPNHAQARARLDKLTGVGVKTPPQKASPPPAVRPAARPVSTPAADSPPRKPAAKPARRNKVNPLWIVGGLGAVVIVIFAVGLGLWALTLRQPQTTRAVSILPTSTIAPAATMPPTWTQTPTRTSSPTPTITPTSTETTFPTPAAPGPTALAYMVELEAQAVELRGLEKRQDVPRYVTNRTAYLQSTSNQETGVDETLELLRMEWAYKSLGLLTPEFDLVNYNQKVDAIGAAAVYVPWDKSIYIFGTHFSGAEGWFYVHEFDHALVDQHYDLSSLGIYPQCLWDSQHCLAIQAVVEGDATLLMYLWLSEKAEYEEYRDLYYYVPPSSLSPGQKQPPAFAPLFNFPYEQGLQFVYYLYEQGGWNAVNRLYSNLPTSTEQILHPRKYLNGEDPVIVSDPAFEMVLDEDFVLANSDSLGEWGTYLMLAYGADPATQLDSETALSAAQGWGGDHYQVYHNLDTGETAMSAHWAWDTQADANQFNQALETYQDRRFGTKTLTQGAATCRSKGEPISCTFSRGRETIWLLAPDQEIMDAILGLYEGN